MVIKRPKENRHDEQTTCVRLLPLPLCLYLWTNFTDTRQTLQQHNQQHRRKKSFRPDSFYYTYVMSFSEDVVLAKFSTLTETQDSIVGISQWVRFSLRTVQLWSGSLTDFFFLKWQQ
jgi:hypothetical protein